MHQILAMTPGIGLEEPIHTYGGNESKQTNKKFQKEKCDIQIIRKG